jgi:hypothetical protein
MLGARRLSRLAIGYGGNPPIGFCDDDAREHFAQTTGASGNRPSHTQNRVHYVTALPGSGKTHLLYRHAGSPTTFRVPCHRRRSQLLVQRAIPGNDPRHSWQIWRPRQRVIYNLRQALKGSGSESHSLRPPLYGQ